MKYLELLYSKKIEEKKKSKIIEIKSN